MLYEELQIKLLRLLRDSWKRVIALDLETHVPDSNYFLKGERILSISFARRISGKFMERDKIELKTIFLDKDDDESEKRLLETLDKELSAFKPLGVIGYGIRQYDIPLLVMKKQHYRLLLWKLIDLTESAVHIDLYHLLKYKGYKKLDQVLYSSEFISLPLKRTHKILPENKMEKGKEVYRLWREEKDRLRDYAEGDVHDLLLIAEKLAFGTLAEDKGC